MLWISYYYLYMFFTSVRNASGSFPIDVHLERSRSFIHMGISIISHQFLSNSSQLERILVCAQCLLSFKVVRKLCIKRWEKDKWNWEDPFPYEIIKIFLYIKDQFLSMDAWRLLSFKVVRKLCIKRLEKDPLQREFVSEVM